MLKKGFLFSFENFYNSTAVCKLMLLPSKMPKLNSVEDSFRQIEKSNYFSLSVFSQAVFYLSLLTSLQHLSTAVSSPSVFHLSLVVALEYLSTAVSSPSVVHFSRVVALRHQSTAKSFASFVHLRPIRASEYVARRFLLPNHDKREISLCHFIGCHNNFFLE